MYLLKYRIKNLIDLCITFKMVKCFGKECKRHNVYFRFIVKVILIGDILNLFLLILFRFLHVYIQNEP